HASRAHLGRSGRTRSRWRPLRTIVGNRARPRGARCAFRRRTTRRRHPGGAGHRGPAMTRGTRGMTLLDLLCGTAIGLVVSGAALAAVGGGLAAARAIGARGEADELAQGAVEAFVFDVRRLGYDPRATGGPTLAQAMADRLTLQSDLDGDGTVDASSEETGG